MTREAKISLLVGLAFIIVIGMLLADYSSNSMQPPPAPLVKTIDNVMDSARAPGRPRQNNGPVVFNNSEPDRVVRIPGNNADDRRMADVRMGPGGNPRRIVVPADDSNLARDNRAARDIGNVRDVTPDNDPRRADPIDDSSMARDGENANSGHSDTTASTPGAREHTAVRGDTVAAMARKYLGSPSKANCDQIIKLNRSLAQPPHRVVVGQKYTVPAANHGVGTSTPTPPGGPVVTPTPPTPVPTPRNDATVSYTTKPGDNLWRIAVEQCGSGAAVAKIRELNKDVLRGGDSLRPNMALKLPAKAGSGI